MCVCVFMCCVLSVELFRNKNERVPRLDPSWSPEFGACRPIHIKHSGSTVPFFPCSTTPAVLLCRWVTPNYAAAVRGRKNTKHVGSCHEGKQPPFLLCDPRVASETVCALMVLTRSMKSAFAQKTGYKGAPDSPDSLMGALGTPTADSIRPSWIYPCVSCVVAN